MRKIITALSLALILLTGCTAVQTPSTTIEEVVTSYSSAAPSLPIEFEYDESESVTEQTQALISNEFNLSQIPKFKDSPFWEINNNQPFFTDADMVTESYEFYAELDSLGRCGVTMACVGQDIMPTEKRGEIGMVKPSGWHTVKYDIVDGKYLYNRCHLLGYQLTGENANTKNLITGTRYLNVNGMLPFENEIADYVKNTNNHVIYRVTPCFEGDNLVATGVLMEAKSVEDNGQGVCFNVFCYNNQPGVEINYATGDSWLITESYEEDTSMINNENQTTYILNKNSMKFHTEECESGQTIKPKNKKVYTGTREELIEQGYSPCSRCKP